MEIAPHRFDVALTLEDLSRIREAIRIWGKSAGVADEFDGARLYRHFEAWEDFIGTDWSDWDTAEYAHDIGCRVWIQVAIEHSTAETAERLRRTVRPLDDRFHQQMKPVRDLMSWRVPVLQAQPYFWETHAIHPELT